MGFYVTTKNNGVKTAFSGVKLPDFEESEGFVDEVIVRVEFRDGAAIDNVKTWRYWSQQWYDISRGIALAVNCAPEDIRVVSAGRGSILIDLAMGLAVARLFTGIISCVTDTALKITKLQLSRNDLRREKLITDALESEFKRKESELKDEAVNQVLEGLNEKFMGEVDGEAKEALSRSVGKLLNFQNRGGQLDFTPPQLENDTDDVDPEEIELLNGLQEEILELRQDQTELKKLTGKVEHESVDSD